VPGQIDHVGHTVLRITIIWATIGKPDDVHPHQGGKMLTTEKPSSSTDRIVDSEDIENFSFAVPDSPAGLLIEEFDDAEDLGADVYNTGLWCWLSWYKTASCCAW